MFDYRLIEAFAAVISEKGFEKASEKLGLTQSAVSQRVRQLEDMMGKILIRRTNPPEVTKEGRRLFSHFRQVDFLEKEFMISESKNSGEDYLKFPVGVNADSLDTWFLPSVEDFIRKNKIAVEIITADQSETDKLLKSGEVLGCISSSPKSIQGCRKEFLGSMRYIAVSAPHFADKYFPEGINPESLQRTPSVFFNRSDNLLEQFFKGKYSFDMVNIPVNYIPSYERFVSAIVMELGYGIVPEIQAAEYIQKSRLVDISPGDFINIELYWHCWNIDSHIIKQFTAEMIKRSAAFLLK